VDRWWRLQLRWCGTGGGAILGQGSGGRSTYLEMTATAIVSVLFSSSHDPYLTLSTALFLMQRLNVPIEVLYRPSTNPSLVSG
jgi:hypothetical protein